MLKVIAFLTMLIDHIGIIFFPDVSEFRIIGRLAFPIFAYAVALGYRKTSNIKNYAIRLFVLAIVSQIPFHLAFQSNYLNIVFTLFLGLLTIWLIDSKFTWVWKASGLVAIVSIAHLLQVEYKSYGIFMILMFYFLHNQYLALLAGQGILTYASLSILRYHPMQMYAVVAILFIYLCRNDRFQLPRIIQYSFYPVHLLLLHWISIYL
ncbi:hypothetical protein BHU72_01985 [Desulfuribacillus stibiiarsenatis]|uniref:Conjugal transfer protein TraX n=1 Tax=Desulfuribacillus stibiiarsenatis TaxID=1390249 RepID=A0A1E5L6J3_9FIRM|nr:TraX family protein [Desulfuribacillus stibiiarsenatis]OEH85593.1 hypothetical protein BHU72_01985 [Desulfuribacillus stibiiarsenatis]